MLSVPFSLIGGIWLHVPLRLQPERRGGRGLHRPGWVAAETGVVMLIYLDQAYRKFKLKYGENFNRRPSQRGHRGRGGADGFAPR